MRKAGLNPRITPAWAGKRHINVCEVCVSEDHPRMGGEKVVRSVSGMAASGSPPHGRGKESAVGQRAAAPRITPAWAGKSHSIRPGCCVCQDHPRMGGEKGMRPPWPSGPPGSPPHGRGKVNKIHIKMPTKRITPAWAGKRLKRSHRSGIFISGPIPFHSVLHRPAGSGGSRAGRDGSPAGQPQNAGPA